MNDERLTNKLKKLIKMSLNIFACETKSIIKLYNEHENCEVVLIIDPRKSDLKGEDLGLDRITKIEFFYNHSPTGKDWCGECINILRSFPHVVNVDLGLDEECLDSMLERYPEMKRFEVVHGIPWRGWEELPNLHTFHLIPTPRDYTLSDYDLVPIVTTLYLSGAITYHEVKFLYDRGVRKLHVEELYLRESDESDDGSESPSITEYEEEFPDLVIFDEDGLVVGKKHISLQDI